MSAKEITRERLLGAAEQTFAEKGFHEALMDEIARRSGTSKGAVYFHFPSKGELFLAVMDRLAERLMRRVERDIAPVRDPRERLAVALDSTVATLCRHRTLARLLLAKGYSLGPPFAKKRQEIYSRFASMTRRLLDQALQERGRSSMDTEVAAYAWLGALSEVVIQWLETRRLHPVRQALPTLRALLLGGLGLEGGPAQRERGNAISAEGPGE